MQETVLQGGMKKAPQTSFLKINSKVRIECNGEKSILKNSMLCHYLILVLASHKPWRIDVNQRKSCLI